MKNKGLFHYLEEKFFQYNQLNFIEDDPILIPHLFNKKEDIESIALLTATIAWGNRKSIINNAKKIVELMDSAPHDFLLNFKPKDLQRFEKFVHRTFNSTDLIYFMYALQNIYKNHSGLENSFKVEVNQTAFHAIVKFREIFFELEFPERTAKHVSNPLKNSSAKRLNMFLRWMIRKDEHGVDFGIWNCLAPHQLYIPLDVHTGNVGRKLKLLSRKQNDWKSVEELTSSLRKFDVNDPVKYDFALFGIGVSKKKLF